MRYARHFSTKQTPQTEKIPMSTQVENFAGGFSWEVPDWTKLDRFLILGTEGGSYYAKEKAMTIKSADAALRCLASDGPRVVNRIVEISEQGRAIKNDAAIFLLALAASNGLASTRKHALESLPKVARNGTHLFQFLDAVQGFRGWGRGLRRAVGRWYTENETEPLAYQLIKYRQRQGWTHRDALRLAKPKAGNVPALKWAVGKQTDNLPNLIKGFIEMEAATNPKRVTAVLAKYPDLPWETIPSEHLASPEVWEALLPKLPMTAMIRNLARMTANGLISPMSDASKTIQTRLNDETRIRKARVHPIAILSALCTYKQGHGIKGSLTWTPVASIIDALDQAFYHAFQNIEPTNKRTVLALDVSGSMSNGEVGGVPGLTPRVASSAMAMVTARTEPNHAIMAFCDKFVPLAITPRQRLDDICQQTNNLSFGGTDCALPIVWALQHKVQADIFIVYTDSETWAGRIHPSQALVQYRQATGIAAKLVVVGMVANDFTIADPKDAGMLDVVGFDTNAPSAISEFARM